MSTARFAKTLSAFLTAATLAAPVALTAAPAAAEPQNLERQRAASQLCLPRAVVAERLGTKFGEARTAGGLASNGALMEIYASKDGGTWTVVMTMPRGLSCIVATGESWRVQEQVALGPGA